MKKTKKEKDVKKGTQASTIMPVFQGKKQPENQALAQCGCTCYCSHSTFHL